MNLAPFPPLAIVADDLTGACDAGVHVLQTGLPVHVLLDPERAIDLPGLCVIATNTRSLPPGEAEQIVERLGGRLALAGRQVLYKKLDSTLHGNFGAEIHALLKRGLARWALVCSAFPDMGRRLSDGELLMGAERKAIGRNLVTLLRQQSGREVVRIRVDDLRAGLTSMIPWIRSGMDRGMTLFAFDADQEEDLDRVVALGQAIGEGALLCGSTGLARALGRSLAAGRIGSGEVPASLPGPALRRVAMLGTRSRITRSQVDWLMHHRGAQLESLSTLAAALRRTPPEFPILVPVDLAAMDPGALDGAFQALGDCGPVFLMLSGGDTARRVCEAAGVSAVRLLGELEMGFPHGCILGGRFDGWPIATKAGGFGTDATLGRWVDRA
jgi:uncharacterized protein YgbK (DUF1537 family)